MSFGEDTGFSNNKRTGDEADLDITPMIDVTFLLLIFFMVTSTMQGTPDLDVPPAKHGEGIEGGVEIVLHAPESPDSPAVIVLDGEQASIEEMKTYVAENISEENYQVVFMADRDVPEGALVEVQKAVAEIETDEEVRYYIGIRDANR